MLAMYAQEINRTFGNDSVRDLRYRAYQQHQLAEIDEGQLNKAANKTEAAGKFIHNQQVWSPAPYNGYAVLAMLDINPGNEDLSHFLTGLQQEMKYDLQPLNGFYMLPSSSFHQTIANTLSAERYKTNILQAGLDQLYPGIVRNAFNNISFVRRQNPVSMRMAGLAIMGNAIAMLGTFDYETDYTRILNFRSGFYEDAQLANLGVRLTRPFIGHITLAYIEQKLNKNQKKHLANTLTELNTVIGAQKRYFIISNAGLYRYDNLSEFIGQENYPVYQFVK